MSPPAMLVSVSGMDLALLIGILGCGFVWLVRFSRANPELGPLGGVRRQPLPPRTVSSERRHAVFGIVTTTVALVLLVVNQTAAYVVIFALTLHLAVRSPGKW